MSVPIPSDITPLLVVPHRPHSRAATKWVLYDPTQPPDRMQLASFDDDMVALAVAQVLAGNLDDFRRRLGALDSREPF